jgi:hypothetical protein
MTNRFDVLKKWLPWLTDTPLVFSTNPPIDSIGEIFLLAKDPWPD